MTIDEVAKIGNDNARWHIEKATSRHRGKLIKDIQKEFSVKALNIDDMKSYENKTLKYQINYFDVYKI